MSCHVDMGMDEISMGSIFQTPSRSKFHKLIVTVYHVLEMCQLKRALILSWNIECASVINLPIFFFEKKIGVKSHNFYYL
jgi:hypothetical protein